MVEWRVRFQQLDRKDARAIREFLAVSDTTAHHVCLQLLVEPHASDALIVQRFKQAELTMRKLTAYEWGQRQKKVNFEALVANPRALAAIQAAAARGTEVSMEMLAVLVMDGSAESIDALLPHLGPALDAADGHLDRLKRLKKYVGTTPAIVKIFSEIESVVAVRNAASPILALGPVIGIGPVTTLEFEIRVESEKLNANNVPYIQGDVSVSSTTASGFRVWLSTVESDHSTGRRTDFGSDGKRMDGLRIGTCTPEELPVWLARAAKTLKLPFTLRVWGTNLRGKKRNQLVAWLNGT